MDNNQNLLEDEKIAEAMRKAAGLPSTPPADDTNKADETMRQAAGLPAESSKKTPTE